MDSWLLAFPLGESTPEERQKLRPISYAPFTPSPPPKATVYQKGTSKGLGPKFTDNLCPKCHLGRMWVDYWTWCGLFWAILFFPVGLLCLFLCRQRHCNFCERY